MVGPVGYEECWFGLVFGQEDGGDQGDVGEMGAAAEGIVEDDDVAGLHAGDVVNGGADGHRHGAEMDGEMIALGDGAAYRIVDRAGVVEALFNVRAEAGAAEGDAHLFGDRDEDGFEDFEFDRVEDHGRSPRRSRTVPTRAGIPAKTTSKMWSPVEV